MVVYGHYIVIILVVVVVSSSDGCSSFGICWGVGG